MHDFKMFHQPFIKIKLFKMGYSQTVMAFLFTRNVCSKKLEMVKCDFKNPIYECQKCVKKHLNFPLYEIHELQNLLKYLFFFTN